jgi:histone H2B
MEDIEDRDEHVRISREESKQGDRERITIERTRHVRKVIEEPKGRMTGKDMTRLARRMIGGGSQSQGQSSLGLSQSQESLDMPDSQEMEEEEEEERTAPAATPKRRGSRQSIVIESSNKTQKGSQQQQKQRGVAGKRAFRGAAPSKAKRARPKRVSHTAPEVDSSFGRYIHKVQQQVHPDLRMSKKTVSIMDSMVVDVYSRVLAESRRLLTASKKKTLTSRDVQTAVRLCFPGELSKHAVSEGQKAVTMSA